MDSGTSKGMIEAENGSVDMGQRILRNGVKRSDSLVRARQPSCRERRLDPRSGGALIGPAGPYGNIMSILCIAMEFLLQCHIACIRQPRFSSTKPRLVSLMRRLAPASQVLALGLGGIYCGAAHDLAHFTRLFRERAH